MLIQEGHIGHCGYLRCGFDARLLLDRRFKEVAHWWMLNMPLH